MANVDQFENENALATQRTGFLAAPTQALSKVRETLDQPGFRRAFPTLLASFDCGCCHCSLHFNATTRNDHLIFIGFRS